MGVALQAGRRERMRGSRSPFVARDGVTDLDLVVGGVPWLDGFTVLRGVDAITGEMTGAAIEPAEFVPSSTKSVRTSYRIISSRREFDQEVSASVSGSYNIEGVEVTASAEYLQSVQYSSNQITLVAEYRVTQESYDLAQSYKLTPAAHRLMAEPATFRKVYGDYFIAGGKRASRFLVTYRLIAASQQKMTDFKASIGASAPEVFSAQGATSLRQAASDAQVSIFIDSFYHGIKSGSKPKPPTTLEEVVEALEEFRNIEEGSNFTALLQHYSTIVQTYPTTVPFAPELFTDLHDLYANLWDIRQGFGLLPASYHEKLQGRVGALETKIVASQSSLISEPTRLYELSDEAELLLRDVNDVLARQAFYSRVLATASSEPPGGEVHEDSGEQRSWSYGLNWDADPAVHIVPDRQNYRQDWKIGWREHTFLFDDQSKIIIGWTVYSEWGDGTNGSWWKVGKDPIIGSSTATIHTKSLYDRGFDWTVTFYYVQAVDYQFDKPIAP